MAQQVAAYRAAFPNRSREKLSGPPGLADEQARTVDLGCDVRCSDLVAYEVARVLGQKEVAGYTLLVHLPEGYKPEQVAPALAAKIQTLPEAVAGR